MNTGPGTAPARGRLDSVGAACLVLILGAAAWLQAPALRVPFFADDYLFLDQVRDRSLVATLASGDPLGNFFRPVGRQIYFWVLAHASGESAVVFHAANTLVFLLIVALVFAVAQRLAGRLAAGVAAALVALTYAADVPIRWASGGQDLLAVAGALGAILLQMAGVPLAAGALLLVALLSKETVVFTPLIAVVLARRAGDSWPGAARRAWPMFAAVVVWAVMWLATASRIAGAERTVEFRAAGPLAALAHLVQTLSGIEWRAGHAPAWPAGAVWGPLLLALAAVAIAAWRNPAGAQAVGETGHAAPPAGARARRPAGAGATPEVGPDRARAFRGGLAWALLGALPVAAVASIWSAYYYLFALCGAALAIGTWAARRPLWLALAVVAALGAGSQVGRHLDTFSTGAGMWNPQSHVNRFYIDRSMRFVSRYLRDMRAARPQLPAGSTVFFSGVPSFVAWQSADGPVVRWAYRDSSLRSYYLTALTLERARRGPVFFFTATPESLVAMSAEDFSWRYFGMVLLLDGKVPGARDAWTMHLESHPEDHEVNYWLGLMEALSNDVAGARRLASIGVELDPGPAPEIATALERVAAGDTTGAYRICLDGVARHGANPGIHALLADVALSRVATQPAGYFEAWLVHTMVPDDRSGMRRWATVLASQRRYAAAAGLFERYLAAGGGDAEADVAVRRWLEDIRRRLPGGALAADELRMAPAAP